MPNSYFYLVASLPEMAVSEEPSQAENELLEFISSNLYKEDESLFNYFLLENDNKNFISQFQRSVNKTPSYPEFQGPSVYSEDFVSNYEENFSLLPSYVQAFISDNAHALEVMKETEIENVFLSYFYEYACSAPDDFIAAYFSFERDLKNILAAFNGRTYGRDFEHELIGKNEIVHELLSNTARDFGLSGMYPFVTRLAEAFEADDVETLETTIMRVVWDYVSEMNSFTFFTAHVVFEYYIKYKYLSRYYSLDPDKGKARLEEIIMKIKEGYKLPAL